MLQLSKEKQFSWGKAAAEKVQGQQKNLLKVSMEIYTNQEA